MRTVQVKPCKRCGRSIPLSVGGSHEVNCKKLPPIKKLVDEGIRKGTAYIAAKYGVTTSYIAKHIKDLAPDDWPTIAAVSLSRHQCKVCGVKVAHSSIEQHKRSCSKKPHPDEVLEACKRMTINQAVAHFGLPDRDSLYKRVRFMYPDKLRKLQQQAARERKQAIRNRDVAHGQPVEGDRCECGMLLDHPASSGGDGERCGMCVIGVQRDDEGGYYQSARIGRIIFQ